MRTLLRILIYWIPLCAFAACTGITQTTSTSATISTSTGAYTCSYFGGYDDLSVCQNTTQTTCSIVVQYFPNATIGNCYFPPSGYEACSGAPTWDWIYTTYSDWCDMGITAGGFEVYRQSRSVISCSSNLCTCADTPVLTHMCANDCGMQTPNPLTEAPTPAPCL